MENKSVANGYIHHQNERNIKCTEHMHLTYEVLIVYEGELTVSINGDAHTVSAQHGIFIMPGQLHSVDTKVDSNCFVCMFSPDNVNEFEQFANICELVNPVFSITDFAFIEYFCAESQNRFVQKSFLYFVCALASQAGVRESKQSEETRLIFKMVEFIKDNYRKSVSLKDMADALEYNYTYMSNCFNRLFQAGFSSTVNSYRITYAKKLLVSTSQTIAEICSDCGFTTIRNFNRAFLESETVTPKVYRKINGRLKNTPDHPANQTVAATVDSITD